MDSSYKLFRILPDEKHYKKAFCREVAHWDRVLTYDLRKGTTRQHPVVQEYENIWITGDREKSWRKFLKETYGSFDHGLSLGGGIGYEEEKLLDIGLIKNLDFIEASSKHIEKFKKRIISKPCAGRINYIVQDINFIDLQAEKYDFIICFTILHHIVNLEHVTYQINKALKTKGILVVYEFIGENKFQWEERKIKLINQILYNAPGRENKVKKTISRPRMIAMNAVTPFEAIRSQDIPGVLSSYLEPIYIRKTPGLIYNILNMVLTEKNQKDRDMVSFLREVCKSDLEGNYKDTIIPYKIFGIYQKKIEQGCLKQIDPWTPLEVRKKLDGRLLFLYRIMKRVKSFLTLRRSVCIDDKI